jgi:signal transduction histidine kinase
MSEAWRPAPTDTRSMLRRANWVARSLGFAWVVVVAFLLYPPGSRAALAVQTVGCCVAAIGLAGWTLLDMPRSAPYRARFLPITLGLVAASAGCAGGAAAGGGGIALCIFGFVPAMTAGSAASLPEALAVMAGAVLATEVSGLVFNGGVGNLVGLPALIVAGLITGRNRGAYRIQAEQAATLLAQRQQLESEQRRAELLDERARIAREIHDVLAHSLGALAIQIQAARSVLADRADIDQASELLAAAQRMASEGLTETRRAVHALRTDTLPLAEELARTTETYAQRYHVAVRFDTSGAPRPMPPDATLAMLRIAQEALVNAAKHATGQAVTMRLDYRDADVRVIVRNDLAPAGEALDGPAAVSTADIGYGLTGMRERLRILDGSLEAGREDGQWVVTARLPLPRPENIAI